MKLTFQVDLDWIENESIDEVIKEELVTELSKKINKNIKENLINEALERIDKQLGEQLNQLLTEILNQNITVTDEWGNTTNKGTLKELVKKKVENIMSERLDDYGNPVRYGGTTRLDWILNSFVKREIENLTKELKKEIDTKVKTYITEGLKDQIVKTVLGNLNLGQLIK